MILLPEGADICLDSVYFGLQFCIFLGYFSNSVLKGGGDSLDVHFLELLFVLFGYGGVDILFKEKLFPELVNFLLQGRNIAVG